MRVEAPCMGLSVLCSLQQQFLHFEWSGYATITATTCIKRDASCESDGLNLGENILESFYCLGGTLFESCMNSSAKIMLLIP